MAFSHGKDTVILIGASSMPVSGMDDISAYCNTSVITRARDSHDVTAYGASAHAFAPGIQNNTFSCGGTYDSTASTGSRDVLQPLADAMATAFIRRRPTGTGSNLVEEAFEVVITSYAETNPVADMITWSLDAQITGEVDTELQL